jgi:hypothetical protein
MPSLEPIVAGISGLGVLFTFTTLLVKRTKDMDARNDSIARLISEERDKATKSRDELQAKYDALLLNMIREQRDE